MKNKALEKSCATCEFATVLQNSGTCVCMKKQEVVRGTDSCRKYREDLLKVKPKLPLLPDDSALGDL